MIVSAKQILRKAMKGKYAVGAFNVYNIETLLAVVKAAEEMRSPVIIQTSASAIKYATLPVLAETIKIAAYSANIKAVIHLDHGKDIQLIKKCIKSGYTSVMFDGSSLPLNKNIAISRKIATLAHKNGVSVEAELGSIGGKEDSGKEEISYTNPEQASMFCEKTGIDSLAISIGTSHGIFKRNAGKLRFDILKKIKETTNIPLVLHGASLVEKRCIKKAKQVEIKIKKAEGIKKNDIKKAIELGICKINVDTDLRLVFSTAMREFYAKNKNSINPREALSYAEEKMKQEIIKHIKLFGSAEKS